ncbi:MAG TPA: inorganic phosphate transporter [Bryobacteraceae bacterium]|nr:inorganic phosphate transporter [Bryobacteraceae bacterium]
MEFLGQQLSVTTFMFLLLALGLALSFEFVNGFHDTANAVATVIYTHSLKPVYAVVWSGCWNLIGVLSSAGTVAFTTVALLPVELVIHVGSAAGFAMVFSLLISAIIWNVGTWYFGLPASSSHTLIGSIMGVGFANSMMSKGHAFGEGVNWAKASEVFTTLLVSPIVGFVCAALLLMLFKLLIKRKDLYQAPKKDAPPPMWIRGLLMLTCTGVSFAHGSNDGQKGMGLIMLILIGVLPATYAVNLDTTHSAVEEISQSAVAITAQMGHHSPGTALAGGQTSSNELSQYLKTTGVSSDLTYAAIKNKCFEISQELEGKNTLADLNPAQRRTLRTDLYLVSESLGKLMKQHKLDADETGEAAALKSRMDKVTKFIPIWVKVAVAFALGLGTMIGWKRIVVTVGEKIGKEHLTYAQGASAELVAMGTILAADNYGLPVSTTHVLSSGIAGTMAANRSGLQMDTLRNVLLAWVLTLPVSVLLGAGIFAFGLNLVLRLGLK